MCGVCLCLCPCGVQGLMSSHSDVFLDHCLFIYWGHISPEFEVLILAILANYIGLRTLCLCCLSTGITGRSFTWVLKIWTLLLRLAEEAFYPLCYLPTYWIGSIHICSMTCTCSSWFLWKLIVYRSLYLKTYENVKQMYNEWMNGWKLGSEEEGECMYFVWMEVFTI